MVAALTTPLVWPEGFPPADWWGRFFTGIPPLGPSVAFFRHLERQQASRTDLVMESWQDLYEREVALRFGECLRTLGWKTPYFIPADQILAVTGGPSYVSYAQQDLAYLLDEFNRNLGRRVEADHLRSIIDWQDSSVRLGQMVRKLREVLEQRAVGLRPAEIHRATC